LSLEHRAIFILNNLHESSDIEESSFDHVYMDRAVAVANDIEAIVRGRLQDD
jgi:hypothetical protein